MKILIVNAVGFIGGAERWILHLVRRLAARGHVFEVACDAGSPLAALALEAGARACFTRTRWRGPRTAVTLARAIQRGGYDLVVSTSRADLTAAGYAARLAGHPGTVARLNSGWSPFDPVVRSGWRWRRHRFYHRHLVQLAATNSRAGKADLVARDYLPAERIVPIYNGVDIARFEPARTPRGRLRTELAIPSDAPLVLSISRYAERKGQTQEVEAAVELVERHPQLHFVFVGPCWERDRPYKEALRAQAQAASGAERIHFLAERDDVPEMLADATLLVRAALTEGLPNCALEAMAMKVPVVATDICGTPEAVLDGLTGRLVPPLDSAAVVGAIDGLLQLSPAERAAIGERGRAHVEANFTLERMAGQYEALFTRALDERTRTVAGAAR